MTQIPIDITADQTPPESIMNHLMALYQKGQLVEVVEQASQLTQEFPHTFMIWNILGAAAAQVGKTTLAENALRQVISLTPDNSQAYNNLAITLNNQGKYDEAEATSKKALTLKPDHAEAYNNLAFALNNQGKLNEAIAAYRQTIALKPDNIGAYYNMAGVFNSQGKLNESVEAYKQAISLKPDYAEAYYNMANALNDQGKYDEAIASYQQLISITPDFAEAHYNMANALKAQSKLDQAITAYKEALTLKPDYAEAYNNMASAFRNQGQYDEAITAYEEAITLKPNNAETYNNLANVLGKQGKYDEATTAYEQAITLKPGDAATKTNFSRLMLKKGELKAGFELMEYRMQGKQAVLVPPKENLRWNPQDDLQGKHFVVYEEQGLGDIIQFCRYLPLLEQRGAKVSFKVKPKLHTLLATLESQTTLMEALPAEEDVDFEAPLLSLPHLLGTTLTNIPAPTPYLYADDANINTWSKVLSNKAFKIGICWQGSCTSTVDLGRSLLLSLFTGLAQISGVELISLHKGEGEEQLANIDFPVTALGSNFDAGNDAFFDTAAVMTLCDLIITSDTSIAHLAGAMGCQTWVALQYSPDWRWMLNRTDSPWYPTMTLYRQRHFGDWQGVFAALEHDVRTQLNPKESFYD